MALVPAVSRLLSLRCYVVVLFVQAFMSLVPWSSHWPPRVLILEFWQRLFVLAFLCGFFFPIHAQQRVWQQDPDKALYDIGVGGGVFLTPDYPGSSQSHYRYLALPYFLYRGKVLRADEEGGVRGRFVSESRWEFDMSAAAAFPADSEDNDARRGMEDLHWIGEVGPRVVYRLIPRGKEDSFVINLPVHVVFSTDFGRIDGRGFLTQPNVFYENNNFIWPNFTFVAGAGMVFATRFLNEYFYEVKPRDALPERPAYRAKPGLIQTKFTLGVAYELQEGLWMGVGYQGHWYENAANLESPLHKEHWTDSFVFGMAWRFYESAERGYR